MINRLIHIITGFVAGISLLLPNGGFMTLTLSYAFIKYETNEQKALLRENGRFDSAYEEIQEFIWGLICGVIMVWLKTM